MKRMGLTRAFPALLGAILALALAARVLEAQPPAAGTPNLNIQEVDLYAVIQHISKRFNKVIIPDQGLLDQMKGKKAKLIMPPSMKDEDKNFELWRQIFENLLTIYGYTYIQKGDLYRLVQIDKAKSLDTPLIKGISDKKLETERIVTAVHVLKHINVDDTRGFWSRVSQLGIPPMPLPDKKTMVITTHESVLQSFLDLLQLIDVPTAEPITKTYTLERASAGDVKNNIQSYINMLKTRKQRAENPGEMPLILENPRSNTLLVSAIKADHLVVEEMISFFDSELVYSGIRPIEIYRLKNSSAKLVAENLGKILKSKSAPGQKPGAEQDVPTIVPFEEQNALIISMEKPESYYAIKQVIEMLDVKRNQVYIVSTIIEVSNTGDFKFGAELGGYLKPKDGKAGLIGASAFGLSTPTLDLTADPAKITRTPNLPSSGTMFAVPYGSFDLIPAVLQLAENNTHVNVIATPSIICDDNEKALIEINEERSYTTTQYGTGNVSSQTFGGFLKAGTTLSIRPTISSDNFLRLEIDETVDRFIPDPSGQARDVKSTRHATTVVTIPNKTSVVIGGLTRQQKSDSRSGVPWLSRIPVLGYLFSSTGRQKQTDTIYIFITPEIISTFDKMREITKEYHNELSSIEGNDLKSEKRFKQIGETSQIKTWRDQREDEYLVSLQRAFSGKNLDKWVNADKRAELADLLMKPGIVGGVLLPDSLAACFDQRRLDEEFLKTLDFVQAEIETWPLEERQTLIARFYVHLAQTLKRDLKDKPAAKPSSAALSAPASSSEAQPAASEPSAPASAKTQPATAGIEVLEVVSRDSQAPQDGKAENEAAEPAR